MGDIFRFYLDFDATTFIPKLTISGIAEKVDIKFTENYKTMILQSPVNLPIYSPTYTDLRTKSYTKFKIPKEIQEKILRWKSKYKHI